MVIRATTKQVSKGIPVLQLMLANDVRLPAKAARVVGRLFQASIDEMSKYEEERRKLFESHGCTVDEKANKWTHADPDKLTAAIKEVDELLDAETEINALPLDLELFKDAEVPGGFYGLDWAMKDAQ